MKVLIIAFGNPDNVLSLSKHLGEKTDLTLMYVVSGDKFKQGILDLDIRSLPNGLTIDENEVKKYLPKEIVSYIGESFKFRFLKTPSRKFIHKKEGLLNYKIIKESSKFINDENYDIIHFNGTSGFLLYLLKHLKANKRVWTLHDYKSHSGEENYSGDLLNKIYTKFNIHHVQHYYHLKKEFIKHFEVNDNTVDNVYSGVFDVYNSFAPKKIKLPEKYILFFGRISKYKGLDVLMNAFDKVKYELDDHYLVVAGEGNIPKDLEGKEKVIYINKYLSPSELVYLVKNCKFVIAPYTDSTHSGVIMTAYNFSKPVIASMVGGMSEVVLNNKTGLLFKNGDVDELADHLYYLCHDSAKLQELSDNVKEFCTLGKINWDSNVNKQIEVYQQEINIEEDNTEKSPEK
jgi:glycosyltransferase involved in cell wall biosynthesis